jgi:hypothetical protein
VEARFFEDRTDKSKVYLLRRSDYDIEWDSSRIKRVYFLTSKGSRWLCKVLYRSQARKRWGSLQSPHVPSREYKDRRWEQLLLLPRCVKMARHSRKSGYRPINVDDEFHQVDTTFY